MAITDEQLANSRKLLEDSINSFGEKAVSMADETRRLRSLILNMGRVIRTMDEPHEHLEFWTQDGDYVLDRRFER